MIQEFIANISLGLGVALTPANIGYCFIGSMVGTLIGVLPGLGPLAAIAMLLPITFTLDPIGALIMLAGIYYGAQYGGSTTAILVNVPGESSSVITCLDGYQMARQGRAGTALATAALGSLFAGTVATFVIALVGPLLATMAQQFGAPEYLALMVFGLVGAVVLANGSVLNAVGMVVLGLILGVVGTDIESGVARYTFGVRALSEGLAFTPVAMGLFGVAEILRSLETEQKRDLLRSKLTGLLPSMSDVRQAFPAVVRGTALGSLLGVLPGGGALLSSFAAYGLEKKIADDPSRFGRGAIEGVAAPEAANNAGAQTSFIPLLTLGIPSNAVIALMLGAMILHGIVPGPRIMTQQPELFWGLIASMWVGNLVLVVINLPLIGLWVRLLRIPYRLLFPAILLFCSIGAYSLSNNVLDIGLMVLFGGLGYAFYKLGCEPAPLLMGFILGPMLEENFRRSMSLSRGDPMIFVQRPISATILAATLMLLLMMILPAFRKTRELAFQD
jgi:putative tricarboxylic transport membrane protein